MDLTDAQREALYTDGLVVLPGIVPRELVTAALRAINSSLGANGINPADLPILRARSYCPELQDSPAILNLLTASPLWGIAEAAIGVGKIRPVERGQIALRFPALAAPGEPVAHLDGMYTPTNGVPEGVIANFTALIGILLSDVPHQWSGNFTVWPGSHYVYERYFRAHGPQSLLRGMPPVDLPAARQISGMAGDAVLCHYQVGHGIAGNSSPAIRYAIFFRLIHIDHQAVRWECMTDIWREWAGMQAIVRKMAGTRG